MDKIRSNKTVDKNEKRESQNDAQSPQQATGPGDDLKRARKASGRELTDFAGELNISKEHLAAIEANQFDNLPGPTFVKGYIRAYARSLELESEPLINLYLSSANVKPVSTARPNTNYEQRSGLGILIGSAILAMAAVTVLTIWLMGGEDEAPVLESDSGVVPAIDVVDSSQSAGQWIDEAPALENSEADKAVRDVLFTKSSNATAMLKTPPIQSEQQQADVIDAPDPVVVRVVIPEATLEEKSIKPVIPEAAPTIQPSSAGNLTPDQAPAQQPVFLGGGSDSIDILLSEDSWVEVQDSSGAVLLQGLYSAGASRVIKGDAPFQVFLGNAPGVAIKFNGEFFDSQSFIRGNNTARFALVSP
jgi:cytoskeleton protein RodZ